MSPPAKKQTSSRKKREKPIKMPAHTPEKKKKKVTPAKTSKKEQPVVVTSGNQAREELTELLSAPPSPGSRSLQPQAVLFYWFWQVSLFFSFFPVYVQAFLSVFLFFYGKRFVFWRAGSSITTGTRGLRY